MGQGSGGNYEIDATFHNTTITVTLDTGSDQLGVPALGVLSCQDPCTGTCLGQSLPKDTLCTTGEQVTPYYDTSTGTNTGAPVKNCYGTGGWYGGCVEAREQMVEPLVLSQATSTRIHSQLAALTCLR